MVLTEQIDIEDYNKVITKLREYFISLGYLECGTQPQISILAACEDPWNLTTHTYCDKVWPLRQTGQMTLEDLLLDNPKHPGLFCITTSYREEKNPVPGRHLQIFTMVEFELHGGMKELIDFEKGLLTHLGFNPEIYRENDYVNVAKEYGVKELEHEHEEALAVDHSPVFFLKNFPNYTSPFWNMLQNDDGDDENGTAAKVDVILHGQETIGSACRSCNSDEMRKQFETITDGKYAQKLYDLFGKDRVDAELDTFLNHNFIPRCGGGIGLQRLVRAMKLSNLL